MRFGERSEPRHVGCYNFKTRSEDSQVRDLISVFDQTGYASLFEAGLEAHGGVRSRSCLSQSASTVRERGDSPDSPVDCSSSG